MTSCLRSQQRSPATASIRNKPLIYAHIPTYILFSNPFSLRICQLPGSNTPSSSMIPGQTPARRVCYRTKGRSMNCRCCSRKFITRWPINRTWLTFDLKKTFNRQYFVWNVSKLSGREVACKRCWFRGYAIIAYFDFFICLKRRSDKCCSFFRK